MLPKLLPGSDLAKLMHVAFTPTRRNRLHWLFWGVTLGIMLTCTIVLHDGQIYGWEQSLTRTFQDVPGRQMVFDLTSPLTNVLTPQVLLIVAVAAALAGLRKQPVLSFLVLLTVPLHIAVQFPKAIFDRPRPSSLFEGIHGVGGFNSFPSGHSEFSITFYGFLTYLIVRRIQEPRIRGAIILLWVLFALGTGFGRVALGRHWPLDVLGGYIGGLGLLSGLVWLHSAFAATRNLTAGPAPLNASSSAIAGVRHKSN